MLSAQVLYCVGSSLETGSVVVCVVGGDVARCIDTVVVYRKRCALCEMVI